MELASPLLRPKKLQRISQACDVCHRRSIRCRPSAEKPKLQCQNCYDFAVDCTYNRPSRRRRNPSLAITSPPNVLPGQHFGPSPPDALPTPSQNDGGPPPRHDADVTGAHNVVREGRGEDLLGVAWRSFALASLHTIDHLLEIYMAIIYPLFPVFHSRSLGHRLKARHHLTDRGFFASVMAACALASARVQDGALVDRPGLKGESGGPAPPASEIFFAAASDAIFKDLTKAEGTSFLRACGLLALTAIQYGQIATMHQYMGHYHTLASMQQFHDENTWPPNLDFVEIEERRRIFWSMYTLDVYTSVVFNGMLKSQETSSNVRYPCEIDDEDIPLHANVNSTRSSTNELNWLRGWNFTTDLYRVLEHTIKRVRRNHQRTPDRRCITALLIRDGVSDDQVMHSVSQMYYELPTKFKNYNASMTGDRARDIFGFQAANIQATLQLVRMTLFSMAAQDDVNSKCDVAEQVLSTFHSIAPQYLRAISTPLVYHLGGIGHILASVMEGLLTEESYQRVRGLLVSMADLLKGLESGIQPTAGASSGLLSQIDKVDRYMEAQRKLIADADKQQQQQQGGSMTSGGPLANGIAAADANGPSPNPQLYRPGLRTPLDEFQLPADVVGEWPWPFDFTQEAGGVIPNGFE